jgi:uncharacterized membrane protein
MILAHATIIFPALLKIKHKPYHPIFYVWLILLNISLMTRIVGDIQEIQDLRMIGGILNGLTFLAYLLSVAYQIIKAQLKKSLSE